LPTSDTCPACDASSSARFWESNQIDFLPFSLSPVDLGKRTSFMTNGRAN
jgi:hypothetical protein